METTALKLTSMLWYKVALDKEQKVSIQQCFRLYHSGSTSPTTLPAWPTSPIIRFLTLVERLCMEWGRLRWALPHGTLTSLSQLFSMTTNSSTSMRNHLPGWQALIQDGPISRTAVISHAQLRIMFCARSIEQNGPEKCPVAWNLLSRWSLTTLASLHILMAVKKGRNGMLISVMSQSCLNSFSRAVTGIHGTDLCSQLSSLKKIQIKLTLSTLTWIMSGMDSIQDK